MVSKMNFCALWRRYCRRNWTQRQKGKDGAVKKRLTSKQFAGFLWIRACLWRRHIATRHVCVCASAPVCHKMIGAIRFNRQSVSPATTTYPSPPTLVILRRKSTEFRLGGFHLRMSSHLPALYLCGDTKSREIKRGSSCLILSTHHSADGWVICELSRIFKQQSQLMILIQIRLHYDTLLVSNYLKQQDMKMNWS